MSVAVSKACEGGYRATVCASTGNTSASAAAYSARAGLESIVILPNGKISPNKLAQAVYHGARVVQIEGNFDTAMEIACRLEETGKAVLVNSLNPHRMQGQKTVAFEIVEQLGHNPPYLNFYPVGNGLNGAAHWEGYKQMAKILGYKKLPIMVGVQAAGAAAMVEGRDIENPETIASAIRIGKPVNREKAQKTIQESNGLFVAVTDEEIIAARKYLAKTEGIFCEPASAASLAGMVKLYNETRLPLNPEQIVVLTLTGSGLKDTTGIDAEVQQGSQKIVPVNIDDVLKVLG